MGDRERERERERASLLLTSLSLSYMIPVSLDICKKQLMSSGCPRLISGDRTETKREDANFNPLTFNLRTE